MSFDALGLAPELLRAVREQEYTTPTPVQSQAIPAVLAGRDLMAAAQTGSGKTAGFTLPMLQRLHTTAPRHGPAPAPGRSAGPRKPRALVLVPTRELCAQVEESVRQYGAYLPLRSAKIFGGVGMQPQIDALRGGVDIVIATPGRLLDHVERRTLDLSGIEILVLDEADRMLDMGFIHAIKRILGLLPKQRQNLLFSATFAEEIKQLADRLLDHPQLIEVTPRNRPVERIEQTIYRIEASRKPDLLVYFFRAQELTQVLVFTRTKHGANRLAEKLEKAGITAAAIHGNKSQNARTKALDDFKNNRVRALVATDIAARGLDIEGLPQVVNFEIPNVPEDYVHRIGRTGRAGAEGNAMSFVAPDEAAQWRSIERLIGRQIAPSPLPDLPPPSRVVAEEPRESSRPPSRGQGRSQGRPQGRPQERAQGGRPQGSSQERSQGRPQGQAQPRIGQAASDRPARDGNAHTPEQRRAGQHPGQGGNPQRSGQSQRGGPRSPSGGSPSRGAAQGSAPRRDDRSRGGDQRRADATPGIETKRYVGAQVVFSSSTPRSRSR